MQRLVSVIMNSQSDWDTLRHTELTLGVLGVPYEVKIISAHRTPHLLSEYSQQAEQRGIQVIIAGASNAAHLPGIIASYTTLPVLGVPVPTPHLNGLDSLLSILQMPAGIAVGALALGRDGAINAALLAAQILGLQHQKIKEAVLEYRAGQTKKVKDNPDPRLY
jgi:5-(carboxyamino)imidazole ribonucleotide mutase